MRLNGNQIVFNNSKLHLDVEKQMSDALTDVVKTKNELFYVAGGCKIAYNNERLPTMLMVRHGLDTSKYECGYKSYMFLPRIFLTYFVITSTTEDIQVLLKWVYQNPVTIYCCAFSPTTDITDETRLRQFLKTCKYKQKFERVMHNNVIKFKIVIDVVYYSLQEYDASYIAQEHTYHDEIDGYNVVLYMHPYGDEIPYVVKTVRVSKPIQQILI